MNLATIVRSVTTVFLVINISSCTDGGVSKRVFKEQLIAQDGPQYDKRSQDSEIVSPDGRRLAHVIRRGGKVWMVLDGQPHKAYDHIGGLKDFWFSPDSKRIAYMAHNGGKAFVVLDGEEGKHYDEVSYVNYLGSPCFSADSQQLLYVARDGAKWLLVIGKNEQKRYDQVYPDSVCVKSDRVVYRAKLNSHEIAVIDGLEHKAPEGSFPGSLHVSPDTNRVAMVIEDGYASHRVAQIVEGRLFGRHYEIIRNVMFSPDSRSMAYQAFSKGKWRVVRDGKESFPYDDIRDMQFWGTNNQLAYLAREKERWFLFRSDRDVAPYDLGDIPPGNRRALWVFGPGKIVALSLKNDRVRLVVNEREGKHYQFLYGPVFSPANDRIAYAASDGSKSWLVLDGKESKSYDEILTTPSANPILSFSNDGRRIAYAARRNGKSYVVVDGVAGKPYDEILWVDAIEHTLSFSPDGKHVAYWARRGNDYFVVIDGNEGRAYGPMLHMTRIVFTGSNKLHYLARKGRNVYLVEERFP